MIEITKIFHFIVHVTQCVQRARRLLWLSWNIRPHCSTFSLPSRAPMQLSFCLLTQLPFFFVEFYCIVALIHP